MTIVQYQERIFNEKNVFEQKVINLIEPCSCFDQLKNVCENREKSFFTICECREEDD